MDRERASQTSLCGRFRCPRPRVAFPLGSGGEKDQAGPLREGGGQGILKGRGVHTNEKHRNHHLGIHQWRSVWGGGRRGNLRSPHPALERASETCSVGKRAGLGWAAGSPVRSPRLPAPGPINAEVRGLWSPRPPASSCQGRDQSPGGRDLRPHKRRPQGQSQPLFTSLNFIYRANEASPTPATGQSSLQAEAAHPSLPCHPHSTPGP